MTQKIKSVYTHLKLMRHPQGILLLEKTEKTKSIQFYIKELQKKKKKYKRLFQFNQMPQI